MHESYTDENYLHNADQQELESQRRRWIMGVNEFAFAIWFFILTPSKDVLCQLNVIDDIYKVFVYRSFCASIITSNNMARQKQNKILIYINLEITELDI